MNEYSVRLAENVYTQGNILIAGALSTGKTTLMRDIGDQLKKKGFSVELITPTPIDGERDYTENFMLTKDFASRLKEYDALLDDRLKTMAAAHVGYYTKANLMPIALIINDFDEYMNDDDYRSVDTIKSIIARLGRLGLRCGIILIILVIIPSPLLTLVGSLTNSTSTISSFKAPFMLFSGINISFSICSSSGTTNPNPFSLALNVPIILSLFT